MFNSESVLGSIARRVFPDMGVFSFGVAKIGLWGVCLSLGGGVAWLTVRIICFGLGSCVGAMYALPAVMGPGRGCLAPNGLILAAGMCVGGLVSRRCPLGFGGSLMMMMSTWGGGQSV